MEISRNDFTKAQLLEVLEYYRALGEEYWKSQGLNKAELLTNIATFMQNCLDAHIRSIQDLPPDRNKDLALMNWMSQMMLPIMESPEVSEKRKGQLQLAFDKYYSATYSVFPMGRSPERPSQIPDVQSPSGSDSTQPVSNHADTVFPSNQLLGW